MSIAISAVIRPSPTLRVAHAALCLAVLVFGAWAWPGPVGALLLAAGSAAALWQLRLVNPAHIDISAVGQIRLTVYQQGEAQHAGMGQSVRLLPGSTLWPGLLLLRLKVDAGGVGEEGAVRNAGRVHWLVVLPDSVAPDVRRRLALAARAVAFGVGNGAKKNPGNP